MTDEQYYNGRNLVLEDADFRVGVTMSLVGPYTSISAGRLDDIHQPWLHVARDNDVPEEVGRVRETLIEEGFTFLEEKLLAQRVHLYTDPAEPNLLLMLGGTALSTDTSSVKIQTPTSPTSAIAKTTRAGSTQTPMAAAKHAICGYGRP